MKDLIPKIITLDDMKEILKYEYSQYSKHHPCPKRGSLKRMIKIFEMRVDNYTLQEIANVIHKTRERVRQIEAKVFRLIKKGLEKEGISSVYI